MRRSLPAKLSLLLLIWSVALSGPGAAAVAHLDPPATSVVYLPLVLYPNGLQIDQPIWTHNAAPADHEVALFRYTFILTEPAQGLELHLFADTRYMAWLDGQWLGRGPARFSITLREYDVYPLGAQPAGSHTLAVLVQWAPNVRRSESTAPQLRGHLQGQTASGQTFSLRTGQGWKALAATAWRANAAQVHSWGLIGPTELLDLRQLPADWHLPDYSDAAWPAAVIRSTNASAPQYLANAPVRPATAQAADSATSAVVSWTQANPAAPIVYQPRSIPFLVSTPVSLTATDAGWLAPSGALGELAFPTVAPYTWAFTATQAVTLTVEVLSNTASLQPGALQLDGLALAWQPAEAARPDVYQAEQWLDVGQHNLVFQTISAAGETFSLRVAPTPSITPLATTEPEGMALPFPLTGSSPFQQSLHAGRRLLLAEPRSALQSVAITPGAGLATTTLNVTFPLARSQRPAAGYYLVLDLEHPIHGRLQAEVSGPAGTVLDIGWDERLQPGAQRPLPYPGTSHPQWNQVDSWILDGQRHTITTIDERSGRYLLIAVWPANCLECTAEAGQAQVRLENLQVLAEQYPLVQTGTFHTNNPSLEQIWQIGVSSSALNMTDAYTDTPWRERGQWWGDAYVIEHINQVAFGDLALLRRGLRYMANSFTPTRAPGLAPNSNNTNMLDYAMLWVHGLAEYGQMTDDVTFLRQLYPTMQQFLRQLDTYTNPDTGLIDLPVAPWSETAYIETRGYASRYGQSTAVNALYYSTLQRAAAIAEQLGDLPSAAAYRQQAGEVQQAANHLLYLPEQGRYLTNVYQGVGRAPTPHAQAWALALGLTPASEQAAVADALLELLAEPQTPNLDIYGLYWVLEGLGQAGYTSQALEVIETYYGYLTGRGANTWWERLNADLYAGASLSHGWGSGATWYLTTYLLGARRTGPATWEVRPALGVTDGITHTWGTLPLQSGVLAVSWERAACQAQVSIGAPLDTHGELVWPQLDPALTLTLNGVIIWQNGLPTGALGIKIWEAPDGLHLALPGGDYVLEAVQLCP